MGDAVCSQIIGADMDYNLFIISWTFNLQQHVSRLLLNSEASLNNDFVLFQGVPSLCLKHKLSNTVSENQVRKVWCNWVQTTSVILNLLLLLKAAQCGL